jgi:deazaflavin-dependent oxidoreductase (nitroreductase family)
MSDPHQNGRAVPFPVVAVDGWHQRSERTLRMTSPADEANEWNRKIIEEFRANHGRVGGNFAGAPLLLLHTVGANSGRERINPLMYKDLGDGSVAVFATRGGAPSNPDWYHNLVANSSVTAEIGAMTRQLQARTATGDERESIWTEQKRDYSGFASYEAMTDRVIPVVILEPA